MPLRSLAAVVLAFTLAIALSGLYTVLGPQSPDRNFVWALLLIVPIWLGIATLLFAAESARKSVAWLAVANVVGYLVLSFTRFQVP